MSRYKDSNCFTQLPWFLLGLRTNLNDALDISAAEMVYGNLLVVPAEFFPSATSSDDNVVGKYTPCRETYKPPAKHYMLTDLHSAMHVFLRNDTSKPPLTPSYTGPFIVIRHSPKAFQLNIRGKEDWVSIDRLKSAYLLPHDPPTLRLSRSGHPI
ncbi:uncharacterized protein [Palaemon carinicauda]|uniref:uncharacterized protein n=1 Tax=Palaemon carinicauda TaxID=392227 RepID=UPI0035B5B341